MLKNAHTTLEGQDTMCGRSENVANITNYSEGSNHGHKYRADFSLCDIGGGPMCPGKNSFASTPQSTGDLKVKRTPWSP